MEMYKTLQLVTSVVNNVSQVMLALMMLSSQVVCVGQKGSRWVSVSPCDQVLVVI